MRKSLLAVALALSLFLNVPPSNASHLQPRFNLFSVEQDVEIGRQSAAEAERQLRLLGDRDVDRYLQRIVDRMAPHAPGAKYPYQVKAVDADEINAFALPGGPLYVNRGLIEAARSEAELAGVLAHEISHIGLRHGTHQASKASLSQMGLGLLGGILSKRGTNTQLLDALGGAGLNVLFLKFSRDDEYEADSAGAEIMAQSGYDPNAMANFFEVLRKQAGRDPGKVQTFLSSHPPSADREARVRQQARSLGVVRTAEVGGFAQVREDLRGMPRTASSQPQLRSAPQQSGTSRASGTVTIEPPATRSVRFEQRDGLFGLEMPSNWQAFQADSGYGTTLVPRGGVVELSDGKQAIVCGLIANHYDPFERTSVGRDWATLEEATDDISRQIVRSNSYLRAGAKRRVKIDGGAAYTVELSGRSPVTRQQERATVYTRALPDEHVLYLVTIAPGNASDTCGSAFSRMLRTLEVNDQASHPGTN